MACIQLMSEPIRFILRSILIQINELNFPRFVLSFHELRGGNDDAVLPVQSRDYSRLLMRDKLQPPAPSLPASPVCVCVSVAQMAMRHFVYIFLRQGCVKRRKGASCEAGNGMGEESCLVWRAAPAEGRASGTAGRRVAGQAATLKRGTLRFFNVILNIIFRARFASLTEATSSRSAGEIKNAG